MSMTNEQMAPFLDAAHETKRIRDRDGWFNPTDAAVIVELVDRLRGALALLKEIPPNLLLALDDSLDDDTERVTCAWLPDKECWEHRRRAFLKSIGAGP